MKLSLVTLAFLSALVAQSAQLINGAGATFPFPLYTRWFSEYQKKNPDIQLNYNSIGSGGGIRQFSEKTVDFGATDAPMNEEQLTKAGAPVLHIPTVLGAVVVTYNLPGVDKPLKLDAELVSDIFQGKVTKWNDARLTKLNPGAKLAGDILVVHRSDGSGTTNIFTDYLAKASPSWKEKVGAGTTVNWPVGLGGKGNEGVAGLVKQTPGTIGYVELIYAANNKLSFASLKNKAGEFVVPSLESVSAAADASLSTIPADYRVSITNADGKKSYPVSGFTYLLVWKKMPDQAKGEALVKFLKWSLVEGQGFAKDLHYAPLPPSLVKKIQASVDTIETKKVN